MDLFFSLSHPTHQTLSINSEGIEECSSFCAPVLRCLLGQTGCKTQTLPARARFKPHDRPKEEPEAVQASKPQARHAESAWMG